jgi:glucokinase
VEYSSPGLARCNSDDPTLTKRYLTIDLGGTRARVATSNDDLALSGRLDEPTDHSRGPESVVAQLARLGMQSCHNSGIDLAEIELAVVASPGPLDTRAGTVFDPPNLPGWNEVPLGGMLKAALGVRTLIVNDANAAALGEFFFGAGRGTRNLVYLTISTGIGGGVVVNGSLLDGTTGSGGELGHMTIDRDGPLCPCGNIGCLEALGSGRAIARRYAEMLRTETGNLSDDRPATARDIAERAAAGDRIARDVFDDAVRAVGAGVVNCVNIFNPDVVVLGGGITNVGERLFSPVREMVARYALPRPRASVRVVPAELGADVGLIGAAGLAVASQRESPA